MNYAARNREELRRILSSLKYDKVEECTEDIIVTLEKYSQLHYSERPYYTNLNNGRTPTITQRMSLHGVIPIKDTSGNFQNISVLIWISLQHPIGKPFVYSTNEKIVSPYNANCPFRICETSGAIVFSDNLQVKWNLKSLIDAIVAKLVVNVLQSSVQRSKLDDSFFMPYSSAVESLQKYNELTIRFYRKNDWDSNNPWNQSTEGKAILDNFFESYNREPLMAISGTALKSDFSELSVFIELPQRFPVIKPRVCYKFTIQQCQSVSVSCGELAHSSFQLLGWNTWTENHLEKLIDCVIKIFSSRIEITRLVESVIVKEENNEPLEISENIGGVFCESEADNNIRPYFDLEKQMQVEVGEPFVYLVKSEEYEEEEIRKENETPESEPPRKKPTRRSSRIRILNPAPLDDQDSHRKKC